jgi:microsomal dipeptidase-like Zn-dependent dipeptidase
MEDNGYPVFDMHCDLLFYLVTVPGAHPSSREQIGCAIPWLRDGNVKLQVLAAFTSDGPGSAERGRQQHAAYQRLDSADANRHLSPVATADEARAVVSSERTGVVFAIENASSLCEEHEPIEAAFDRLKQIGEATRRVFYIGLTHHGENRFGGGSGSKAGLKADGRTLLDHLDGKEIAIDLSHASDALAHDVLEHTDHKKLDVAIIASHSNFRAVWDHPRNLPDDIALELIHRNGLIGIALLREYVHPQYPEKLVEHIEHGLAMGGEHALCFGADFFCTAQHPDRSRAPFFFPEHENAGAYQRILASIDDSFGPDCLRSLAYRNVARFIERIWAAPV